MRKLLVAATALGMIGAVSAVAQTTSPQTATTTVNYTQEDICTISNDSTGALGVSLDANNTIGLDVSCNVQFDLVATSAGMTLSETIDFDSNDYQNTIAIDTFVYENLEEAQNADTGSTGGKGLYEAQKAPDAAVKFTASNDKDLVGGNYTGTVVVTMTFDEFS